MAKAAAAGAGGGGDRVVAIVLGCYACCNIALSFINKAVVRRSEVNIGLLLLAQCLATVTIVRALARGKWKREGGGAATGTAGAITLGRVALVLPASALYAAQHYTRMATMTVTSVDAILVARQLVPVLCAMLEGIAAMLFARAGSKPQPQTPLTFFWMWIIVAGVATYAYGKAAQQGAEGLRYLCPMHVADAPAIKAIAVHVIASAAANVYTRGVCQRMPASDYTVLVNLASIPIFLSTTLHLFVLTRANLIHTIGESNELR